MPDFEHKVAALRQDLLHYARHRLRNSAWAEDAVSECLLAALENPHAFGGRSELRTWLIGILKHKMGDQFRINAREANFTALEDATGPAWDPEPKFSLSGLPTQALWAEPESCLQQKEFLTLLEAACNALPPAQSRAFILREIQELDTEVVCQTMGINATNLWVLLHRARLRLRHGLRQQGLDAPDSMPTPL